MKSSLLRQRGLKDVTVAEPLGDITAKLMPEGVTKEQASSINHLGSL